VLSTQPGRLRSSPAKKPGRITRALAGVAASVKAIGPIIVPGPSDYSTRVWQRQRGDLWWAQLGVLAGMLEPGQAVLWSALLAASGRGPGRHGPTRPPTRARRPAPASSPRAPSRDELSVRSPPSVRPEHPSVVGSGRSFRVFVGRIAEGRRSAYGIATARGH
jgi:hypothetical protein